MEFTKNAKVALSDEIAKEDASQVPYRAIVHLCDGENPPGTLCRILLLSRDKVIDDLKRVVSCPDCSTAARKAREAAIGTQLALADSELVTVLYQRATIAIDAGFPILSMRLSSAAMSLEQNAQISHDTSVPQAGDDALTPPKDGFNCDLCDDTGTRYGKRCECDAGKAQALMNEGCEIGSADEICKFCGVTVDTPCDAPPMAPCEEAHNHHL